MPSLAPRPPSRPLGHAPVKRHTTDPILGLNITYIDIFIDAYNLYVYGVVLRKLNLSDLAVPILCESIKRK